MSMALAVLTACGSSSSPVAPSPPVVAAPGTPPPSVITLSASGFSPQELTVPIGGRVTFHNADRIGHDIASGLEHNAPECREIDLVGFLVAGERRDTAIFEQAKTCRFHDHDNVGAAAFQGQIVIR